MSEVHYSLLITHRSFVKRVVMKKILIALCGAMISFSTIAQSNKYDTLAVLIIDRMADVIGDLESCSFKLNVANDVNEPSRGLVKRFSDFDVYMGGPDKMLVNVHGYKGHREMWYNGEQMAYYSFDENNYGILKTPDNIIKTIDSVNDLYDIEFPAADFFYPAFTDDLLQSSDSLRFLGVTNIGGKQYFDVISYGKEMNIEFWINDVHSTWAFFQIGKLIQTCRPPCLISFHHQGQLK